jgi:hypothetical protein
MFHEITPCCCSPLPLVYPGELLIGEGFPNVIPIKAECSSLFHVLVLPDLLRVVHRDRDRTLIDELTNRSISGHLACAACCYSSVALFRFVHLFKVVMKAALHTVVRFIVES